MTPRTAHRTGTATTLRITSPAPRDVWEEAFASDPTALVFQSPAWLDCLRASGRYRDASRLYELASGRRLVLPMARLGGAADVLAVEASFPPGWGYGGVLASGGARADDVAAVFSELSRRKVMRTSLHPNPLVNASWAEARPRHALTVPRLAHVLNLDGGFARVWEQRFTGSARTAVRKAERSGLTVECDTTGRHTAAFYELFERSLDRWAAAQHEPRALARWRGHRRDPLRKLQLMAQWLGEACRVWVAWLDGRPAAAILVIRGPSANYTRGAMDKALAGPTRANYLLHRLAVEDACDAGCRYYHMGETGRSAALAQFKTRFGARPQQYAEYHIEAVPLIALDRALRRGVKRVIGFKDVPSHVQPVPSRGETAARARR
jgi:Acetyltransferase (GNAT) domain